MLDKVVNDFIDNFNDLDLQSANKTLQDTIQMMDLQGQSLFYVTSKIKSFLNQYNISLDYLDYIYV